MDNNKFLVTIKTKDDIMIREFDSLTKGIEWIVEQGEPKFQIQKFKDNLHKNHYIEIANNNP